MSDMESTESSRQLVILNQAANYLTVGFANAFNRRFDSVTLITGSVHVQGEELDSDIVVHKINRWHERPALKKAASYVLALFRMWWLLMTRYRHHEVFFVSVPPMAYLLNLFLPNRFSMIIWDIYPDILAITGMKQSHPVFKLWAWMNRRSFAKAYRLFTISEVMADSLSNYVSRERIMVQPIWSIFDQSERIPRDKNKFLQRHRIGEKFIVQYSGNIGVTHNVESLLDVAEKLKGNEHILFQIIGRGPRESAIRDKVEKRALSNVQLLPFQADDIFPHSLSAADLGVVVLNERVSQGSVPSKVFNLMSFGIPGLYIASTDSQLARYASTHGNARCFQAEETDEIANWIESFSSDKAEQLRLSQRSRVASAEFSRSNADKIVQQYIAA